MESKLMQADADAGSGSGCQIARLPCSCRVAPCQAADADASQAALADQAE